MKFIREMLENIGFKVGDKNELIERIYFAIGRRDTIEKIGFGVLNEVDEIIILKTANKFFLLNKDIEELILDKDLNEFNVTICEDKSVSIKITNKINITNVYFIPNSLALSSSKPLKTQLEYNTELIDIKNNNLGILDQISKINPILINDNDTLNFEKVIKNFEEFYDSSEEFVSNILLDIDSYDRKTMLITDRRIAIYDVDITAGKNYSIDSINTLSYNSKSNSYISLTTFRNNIVTFYIKISMANIINSLIDFIIFYQNRNKILEAKEIEKKVEKAAERGDYKKNVISDINSIIGLSKRNILEPIQIKEIKKDIQKALDKM